MGESGRTPDTTTVTESRTSQEGATTAPMSGVDGEERVTAALGAMPEPWLVLHRRLLVPGVPETALNHVLVGPAGVVLVDSIAWDGTVREWQGSLVRQAMTPDGGVVRRSLHAEVARIHRLALEMSARLRRPVTPVACLSGVGAARFGAPRMVRGIWVVPVDEIAAWVATQSSSVAPDELDALRSHVRGEFAASSGDSSLRPSIGHDVVRQRSRAARAARAPRAPRTHRAEAARRTAGSTGPVGADSRAGQRRMRRRRERLRTVLTIAFLTGVLCASVTGVVTGALVAPY